MFFVAHKCQIVFGLFVLGATMPSLMRGGNEIPQHEKNCALDLVMSHGAATSIALRALGCTNTMNAQSLRYLLHVRTNQLQAYVKSIGVKEYVLFEGRPVCVYIETLTWPGKKKDAQGKKDESGRRLVRVTHYGEGYVPREFEMAASSNVVPPYIKPFSVGNMVYMIEKYTEKERKPCFAVGISETGDDIQRGLVYVQLDKKVIEPSGFLTLIAPELFAELLSAPSWSSSPLESELGKKIVPTKLREELKASVQHVLVGDVRSLDCVSLYDKKQLAACGPTLRFSEQMNGFAYSIYDFLYLSNVSFGHLLYSWGNEQKRIELLSVMRQLSPVSYTISGYGTFFLGVLRGKISFEKYRFKSHFGAKVPQPTVFIETSGSGDDGLTYLEKRDVFVKKDWYMHATQLLHACMLLRRDRYVSMHTKNHAAFVDTLTGIVHRFSLPKKPKKAPVLIGSDKLPKGMDPADVVLRPDGTFL